MRTIVQAKSWPSPRFRYSPLVAAGPFVKTAGMIALDSSTGELEKGGPGAETAKILSVLGKVLSELKLETSSVVSVTVYTTDFDRFSDINAAWNDFFDGDTSPPRAHVGRRFCSAARRDCRDGLFALCSRARVQRGAAA
jgi:2-iminobutanoate/2-iminopropanoate deaminase